MKKSLLFLALLGLVLSCGKQEQSGKPDSKDQTDQTVAPSERKFPTSLKFKSVDISDAAALAVMSNPSAPSNIRTRADGNGYRLYIVDTDGETKLASFEIEVEGNQNDTIWKEIIKTLTLVPTEIVPYSNQFVLLKDVHPVCDYEWEKELSLSDSLSIAIRGTLESLFNQVTGNYLLRLSDGALFNSPVSLGRNSNYFDDSLRSTADGKNMVLIPFREMLNEEEFGAYTFPVVLSDMGDNLQMKTPSQQLFEWRDEDYAGFFITTDNRVIPLVSGNGTWTFSLDLNPLFMDYSDNMKPIIRTLSGAARHNFACQIGDTAYLLYWKSEKVQLYRVFVNEGVIDCERIGDSSVRFPKYLSTSNAIRKSETGIVVFYNGGISRINVLTGEMSEETIPAGFPGDPLGYDENGIAYTCDGTDVQKFNINTREKTTIPIKWSTTEFGGLVSITNLEYMGGAFIITGLTRTAQTVTVVVDAETGDVNVATLDEYGGSIITSYYRLN